MSSQSLPTISRERTVHIALCVLAIAFLVLWNAMGEHMTAVQAIPAFALFGAGLGLILPRMYRSVPFIAGGVSGMLIVAVLFVAFLSAQLPAAVQKSDAIPEAYKAYFSKVLTLQTADIALGAEADGGARLPESLSFAVSNMGHESVVSAAKNAVAFGGLLAILGFVASLVIIPEKKKDTAEPGMFKELYNELVAIDLELTTASS